MSLKDRAIAAFQAGNTQRAYTLLQAHALQASDAQAVQTLSDYRWASHNKRPQLGLRIAVGASIKNPQNQTD
ncbi:MAG: hypothetical protein ACOVQM_11070, partial [Pirellula sp.]